jgi:hypothetical protein
VSIHCLCSLSSKMQAKVLTCHLALGQALCKGFRLCVCEFVRVCTSSSG